MTATIDGDADETERYGSFETADGGVVVYDRNRPEAWLQSDVSVTALL